VARYPDISAAGRAVPPSIFARLREHLARFPGDVIPLQIGDTHLAPPMKLDEVAWQDVPATELYAYGTPAGWQPLIEAIAADARERRRVPVGEGGVQITVGATHALSCAVEALCDPGDELILLTPHWPLIRGIALAKNVVPVEVGFPATADVAEIAAAITPRTAAIYLATPNNPDGAMLSRELLAAIAELADRHGLWILADEVYEHYLYDREHVSIAALPAAAARTITVYSFAKSYAQAGLRVGYSVASDPKLVAALRSLANHSVYNVPVAMQRLALGALRAGPAFIPAARDRYRAARDVAHARLLAPAAKPPGGAYLWVDFRRWSGDDCMPVLERVAASGVLLAPGSAFGDACRGFARLCFTGVPEPRLEEGIDRINRVLEAFG
jgi:N-succinyldiaminopimelate aminotransferase